MKTTTIFGFGMMAALFTLGSCSDEWDNHYAPAASESSSLWEGISSDASLSRFARVLQATGFDKKLNGSQTYTVFAMTDAALSEAQADSLIEAYGRQRQAGVRDNDNTVVTQFVKNHIALYRHPVSPATNDSLRMMNNKYAMLTPATVGGRPLATTNALHSNGVLFTVGGRVSYFPNVYEYLGHDAELDSVYQFLSQHTRYVFNEAASVPGGIVDGRTVYLDSVMSMRNDVLDAVAPINSEDSTYWMVVPTNAEWSKKLETYRSYFNYENTVDKRDSLQETQARLAIIRGAVFSRTKNTDAAVRDSAVSTEALSYTTRRFMGEDPYYVYYRPFETGGAFYGTTAVACSNGQVLKASDYHISDRQTFNKKIVVETDQLNAQDTIIDADQPLTVHTVQVGNPFYGKLSQNSLVEIVANNTSKDPNHFPSPTVLFRVPDVLSNMGYDIYVVTAPLRAFKPDAGDDEVLPNKLLFNLLYNNQDGKLQQRRLGVKTSDPTKPDTILVTSNFKFPTCSYGLTTPTVKLRIQSQVRRNETSKYSSNIYLDCIILKPHED